MPILTPGNYAFLLEELPKHKGNYLEIGVYEGEAVRGLALQFPEKTIYAIDPFIADFGTDGHAGVPIGARLEVQRAIALENWNHIPNIKFFEQTSVSFAQEKSDEELAAMNVSVVYVDGAHDYDNALNDLILSARVLRKGGLIVVDDSTVPSVKEAIEYFISLARNRLMEPIDRANLRLKPL